MPEFEMPAEVDAPPRPERPAPTTVRPQHTAEPDASDTLESPRRSGLQWRHLLIAGVLGALVGAAIPGGIQVVERGAASADEANLRAVATDYLTAVAEGRAADATAIVPLPTGAEAMPDAVLESAIRIDEAEVRLVRIDGDVGSVEVRFELGAIEVQRTLDADRVDGSWWLASSLAEEVSPMFWGLEAGVTLAGAQVAPGVGIALYPGIYSLDTVSGPIIRTRSEPFAVDGDPASVTEVYVDAQLAPEVMTQANELALAVAAECQATPGCSIPAELDLDAQGAYIHAIAPGTVDLSAQLATASGIGQWFEVRLRIETDERGMPSEWLCGKPGEAAIPVNACPAPAESS